MENTCKYLFSSILSKIKRECYSRVPQLSDTRYSASVNANEEFLNFSGISIDIGE